MSSGGQRRELTEREALEENVRLARGRYAYHRAEMETAERQMNAVEAKLMAFAAAERAEMEKASGLEPAGV